MIRGKSHQAMSVIKGDAEETSGDSAKLVCSHTTNNKQQQHQSNKAQTTREHTKHNKHNKQLSTIGALALTDLVKSTLGPKGMVCYPSQHLL